jgi:hypothetical protein
MVRTERLQWLPFQLQQLRQNANAASESSPVGRDCRFQQGVA